MSAIQTMNWLKTKFLTFKQFLANYNYANELFIESICGSSKDFK